MDNTLIAREQLKQHSSWLDKDTFITCIKFSDFPKGLLNIYKDMITEQDIIDGSYLSCEYWINEDCYVYNFNFKYDSISVNEYFNKPLYNDMIKSIVEEIT